VKNVSRLSQLILTLTFAISAINVSHLQAEDPADKPAADKKEAAREVKVGDITLAVPAAWKQQAPANRLRLAQFEIPASGDDKEPAELSIFNFGAGGTVDQQVERWKGQFLPENRKFSMEQGKVELGEYVLVELSGTFKKPVGPPVLRKTVAMPGAAMHVAMVSTEKGIYFLKLVGLQSTVNAAASDFRKSIGVGEKKTEAAASHGTDTRHAWTTC